MESKEATRLRIIHGGAARELRIGAVRIVAAPRQAPPFAVDAVAEEQDADLLLGEPGELHDPGESVPHLMIRALNARRAAPGSVLVRGRDPLRLLAIVHDFERDPTWREEWVAQALRGLLDAAADRRLSSLALPLLGTRHGSLAPVRFTDMLGAALAQAPPPLLRRIWLVLPERVDPAVLAPLRHRAAD